MSKMKMPEVVKRMPDALVRRLMGVVRPTVKVKLTRKNLYLSYPAKKTGEFHVLPRPGTAGAISFLIEAGEESALGNEYGLWLRDQGAGSGGMLLGSFATREEAQAVLSKINNLLTGSKIGKWAVRAVLLWLVYLFVTSYMQVSQQAGNAVAAANPAAFVPPANTGFQDLPSVTPAAAPVAADAAEQIPGVPPGGDNLSNYIYAQAMAAKAKAEHESMPPKTGGETAGLDSFGLDAGGQKGPGCDPKLAFKAPKQ